MLFQLCFPPGTLLWRIRRLRASEAFVQRRFGGANLAVAPSIGAVEAVLLLSDVSVS